MKKLFNEFKKFINRGNVVDLAVGMIIGSAFTAIVNSLVKGILTPLINWIPGADGTGALQTVLRQAVLDAEGNVVTEALILDWGSVISAIITFLCTAAVLFLLVKLFNKIKETGAKVKEKAEEVADNIKDNIKNGFGKDDGEEEAAATEETTEETADEETPAAAETVEVAAETPAEEEEKKETTEDLLRQIVELLKDGKAIRTDEEEKA